MRTDQLIQVTVAGAHTRLSLPRYLLHGVGQSSPRSCASHCIAHCRRAVSKQQWHGTVEQCMAWQAAILWE